MVHPMGEEGGGVGTVCQVVYKKIIPLSSSILASQEHGHTRSTSSEGHLAAKDVNLSTMTITFPNLASIYHLNMHACMYMQQ